MANHWTDEPHGGTCFICRKPAATSIKKLNSCSNRACHKRIVELLDERARNPIPPQQHLEDSISLN